MPFAGGRIQYAKMDEVKLTHLALTDSRGVKREIVLNLEHLDKLNESSLTLHSGRYDFHRPHRMADVARCVQLYDDGRGDYEHRRTDLVDKQEMRCSRILGATRKITAEDGKKERRTSSSREVAEGQRLSPAS